MLDDLRTPQEETYPQAADQAREYYSTYPVEEKPPTPRFLGMTPFQRFVIIFLIFMLTCVLGSFCLLVTEKVVPPIF